MLGIGREVQRCSTVGIVETQFAERCSYPRQIPFCSHRRPEYLVECTLFQGVGKDGMNDREVVGLVDVGESECCVRQIEVVLG